MPLLTGVIDPIPHDEDVFNLEPYVIRHHVNFGTARFAKQTRGLQAGWTSRPKKSRYSPISKGRRPGNGFGMRDGMGTPPSVVNSLVLTPSLLRPRARPRRSRAGLRG